MQLATTHLDVVDEHSSFPFEHFAWVAAEVGAKNVEKKKENTTPAPPLWIFEAPPPIS